MTQTMEFNHYILPNGIRCIHKQVRSAVVHCALTVNTGSRDELDDEYGLAHLLEHAFFKGTEKRKAYHINCRLENLGGELNAYTTKEETVLHTTTLSRDTAKAVELLTDILFHSRFPEQEVEKEKLIILDEINSYKDSPSEQIFDEFEELLFAGSELAHPILGTKRSLKKLHSEQIQAFHQRTYNTDQMVFSLIGNLSEKRFRAYCDRYFGEIPANTRSFTRTAPTTIDPFTITRHRNCYQAHCLLGSRAYSLNQSKRTTLALMTNLLGGPSANSLLNLAVRERNGLSYTIEANFSPLSDSGVSSIYFSSDREQTDQCIELIEKELQKLQRGEITPRFLNIAKKQFIGQWTIASESNESYMLAAARSYLYYNCVDSAELVRQKILSITTEQIAEVAQELYGANYSTLIFK